MANYNNPNGFKPFGSAPMSPYTTSAAVTRGDLLAIVAGAVTPFVPATHDDVIGVAAHDANSGAQVMVFDDPSTLFVGQTSGSYAAASHDGELVGVEGATGAMEVDEDGTEPVLAIIRHYPMPGAEDVGANARVLVSIAKHAKAPAVGFSDEMKGRAHIADSAAETQASLTDNSSGTASATDEVVAVGATNAGDESGAINNNFATVARELAAAKADNAALRATQDAILARLEAAGINATS